MLKAPHTIPADATYQTRLVLGEANWQWFKQQDMDMPDQDTLTKWFAGDRPAYYGTLHQDDGSVETIVIECFQTGV